MVHMNMHGNDWERRHRSVATFLASIMMREKIIWRMVGSIPPSLNDCTSRARPGAARVNAPRRGRPPLPCTGPCKTSAATGRGSRRRRVYRYRSCSRRGQESWLAVARNLPRLVIHVAGLWSISCSGQFEVVSFAVLSLHFSQDSVSFAFVATASRASSLARAPLMVGRQVQEEEKKGRWGGRRGCSCRL